MRPRPTPTSRRRILAVARHMMSEAVPPATTAAVTVGAAGSVETELGGVRIASRSLWRQPPARTPGTCRVAVHGTVLTPDQLAFLQAAGDDVQIDILSPAAGAQGRAAAAAAACAHPPMPLPPWLPRALITG